MFDIKNQRLNPNSKYEQGFFDKYNPRKYVGKRPIVYRSSYEKKFMEKMEINPRVVKWTSEMLVIPYTSKDIVNGRVMIKHHKYFTDFVVWTSDGKKFVVEVKPQSLVPLNENEIRINPAKRKNAMKWAAAIRWCKANGYEFKIVTENHLRGTVF